MRAHLVCNVVGTVLTATAFVAIYVNKNRLGKDHFTSWHGLFGALCVLFIAANASTVGGVCRCRRAYLSYPGCFNTGHCSHCPAAELYQVSTAVEERPAPGRRRRRFCLARPDVLLRVRHCVGSAYWCWARRDLGGSCHMAEPHRHGFVGNGVATTVRKLTDTCDLLVSLRVLLTRRPHVARGELASADDDTVSMEHAHATWSTSLPHTHTRARTRASIDVDTTWRISHWHHLPACLAWSHAHAAARNRERRRARARRLYQVDSGGTRRLLLPHAAAGRGAAW